MISIQGWRILNLAKASRFLEDDVVSKKISSGSIINVKENGREYVLRNPDRLSIAKVRSDGELYQGTAVRRPDYMLSSKLAGVLIMVELKGSHIDDAATQILTALRDLRRKGYGYRHFHGRIVASRNSVHGLKSVPYMTAEREFRKIGGSLRSSSVHMEESISGDGIVS